MGAETDEQKLKNQAVVISRIAIRLCISLFAILLLYVFLPSGFFSKKVAGDAMPAYDSMRTVIQKDTVKIDSITKLYRQTEEKVTRSAVKKANTACEDCTSMNDRLENTYKYFILVFGTLLLLLVFPRLLKFKITKDGIEGELSPEEKAKANAEAQEENSTLTDSVGKKQTEKTVQLIQNNVKRETQNAFVEYDPQKGLWGGLAENNSRKVAASFKKSTANDWIKITLTVTSTKPDKLPLTDYVMFHLHSTFPKPNVKIYVLNGVAEYSFYAWGAFTLGVETDFGENFLELDLSTLPEAPEPFKSR